uniref:Uncharacterized protein n=1 Tax=Vitis vinifera TaxID=29760 RepID=A5AW58_VITVI|nr:hypothetical protein VITISV_036727 [Vitis vinifera]
MDLTESSLELESEPTPSPPPAKKSPPLAKKPQPSQTPTKESQIPSGMTPESMTTNQVRDPTVIHFTIDGRHGILGARHIAEALHIPYELARPEDFRAWTHPSQSDIVHTLSKGASSHHYILRKELPPNMFFIDALLRHNISHFNIGCRGEESCWRHCLGSLRDTSLALIISSWPLFYILKRRCIGRSYSEQMPFHFSSPDYYARYWSTRDTQQSLSMSVDAFVERYSLLKNGPGAPAGPEHPQQPEEPVDIPADTQPPAPAVAPTEPIPEVAPSSPQATPQTPPVILPTSEPSPSAEPRTAIPIIEYRGLCHTFQALATSQSILTQKMTTLRAHQK